MLSSELGNRQIEEDPLSRFHAFLGNRRNGSILRAWRLDLDKNGVGQVPYAEFVLAMRRMGVAAEARSVWESLRPDGSSTPLYFHELAPREAANLEDFANTLWKEVGFEFDHAWSQYIDMGSRRVVTLEEFVRGLRRLGFQGNAQLLFRGFDMSGPNSMLTRRDFESMRALCLELVRCQHGQEATKELALLVQELGGLQDFATQVNFSSAGRKGSQAADCTSMPVAIFASRLRTLGFKGDCLAAAASAARGNGLMVTVNALRALLTGDDSACGQSTRGGPVAERLGISASVKKMAKVTSRIEPGTVSDISSPRPSQKLLRSPGSTSKNQLKVIATQTKASHDGQTKPTLADLRPKGVNGLKGLNAAHGGGFKSGTPMVIVDVGRGGATKSASSRKPRKRPGESSSSGSSDCSSSTGFSSSSDESSDGSDDGKRHSSRGGRRHRKGHRGVVGGGGGDGMGNGSNNGSHKGMRFRGGQGQGNGSGGHGYGGGQGLGGSNHRSGRRTGGNGGCIGGEGGTGGGGGGGRYKGGFSFGSPHKSRRGSPKHGDGSDSGEECCSEVCTGNGIGGGGRGSSRSGKRRVPAGLSGGTGEVSDGTSLLAAIATGCTGGTPRPGHSSGRHRRHSAFAGKVLGHSSPGDRRRSLGASSEEKGKGEKGERRSSVAKDGDDQDESKDEDAKGEKGKGKKGKGAKGKGEADDEEGKDEEANGEKGEKGKGKKGKGKGEKGKSGPPTPLGEKGKDGKGKDGKGKGKDGKGQENFRKPEIKPPVVLKKLFWSSFRLEKTEAETKTIWDAIEKDGVDMNFEELDVLFKDEPPGMAKSSTQNKDEAKDVKALPTRQRLQVLENQRRRQICVMLARLPGMVETKLALQSMNQDKLSKDQVELLLLNVPGQEEIQLMEQAKKDHANDPDSFWDNAEEFVFAVMEISQLQLRLQVWDFENNFQERFDDILNSVTIVEKGCHSVLNSQAIRRLLALMLYTGNYLNAGTNRGRADGFSLDTLSKMRSVKITSADRPGSLVDYIVQQMERTYPAELEALFVPGRDADCISQAARPKLEDLAEDAKSFRRTVGEMLIRVRQAREKGDDAAEVFLQHSEILSMCDVELEELQVRTFALKNRHAEICKWFHTENTDSKMTLDEFFGVWDKFLGDVKTARKDYQAQEKKREAQALQEKQKQDRQASIDRRKNNDSRNSSLSRPPSRVRSTDACGDGVRRTSGESFKRNIRRNFPSVERRPSTPGDSKRKSLVAERKSFSAPTFASERRSSLICHSPANDRSGCSPGKRSSMSVMDKRASLKVDNSLDKRRFSLPDNRANRRASLPCSPGTRSSFGLALQLRYSAPSTPDTTRKSSSADNSPRAKLAAEDSSTNKPHSRPLLDSNRRSVRHRTQDSIISDTSEIFDSPRSRQGFAWAPDTVEECNDEIERLAMRGCSSAPSFTESSLPKDSSLPTGAALWQAAVKQIMANRNTLWSNSDREEVLSLGRELRTPPSEKDSTTKEAEDASLPGDSTIHLAEPPVLVDAAKSPHIPPIDLKGALERNSRDDTQRKLSGGSEVSCGSSEARAWKRHSRDDTWRKLSAGSEVSCEGSVQVPEEENRNCGGPDDDVGHAGDVSKEAETTMFDSDELRPQRKENETSLKDPGHVSDNPCIAVDWNIDKSESSSIHIDTTTKGNVDHCDSEMQGDTRNSLVGSIDSETRNVDNSLQPHLEVGNGESSSMHIDTTTKGDVDHCDSEIQGNTTKSIVESMDGETRNIDTSLEPHQQVASNLNIIDDRIPGNEDLPANTTDIDSMSCNDGITGVLDTTGDKDSAVMKCDIGGNPTDESHSPNNDEYTGKRSHENTTACATDLDDVPAVDVDGSVVANVSASPDSSHGNSHGDGSNDDEDLLMRADDLSPRSRVLRDRALSSGSEVLIEV